jgi:iron(II)-dependent oxidoreductase
MDAAQLASALKDARERLWLLTDDLDDSQLQVPQLSIVNPFLWELGHVAWFQERWLLRRDRSRARVDRDALYDSSRVSHGSRWILPLLEREEVRAYLDEVLDQVLALCAGGPSDLERYFLTLVLFHEDMHAEALAMTRQTLGYPTPFAMVASTVGQPLKGDVEIPGGVFTVGAPLDGSFCFDNEKWAHAVEVAPFAIARACVTQAEFADFVDDGGYRHRALWSEAGWAWREENAVELPVYWRREGTTWLRRDFDRWRQLEPSLPMVHASWFEADAYCRWANRRLPTELEWEVAACAEPSGPRAEIRRAQPWGEGPSTLERANLDAARGGLLPVEALAGGDSAFGCRQMIGNVWEWTASDFAPFPGFSADPYEDYSKPWFGGGFKVLKGGAWMTRSRLIRPGFRNFYAPERRDVFAGFRTAK